MARLSPLLVALALAGCSTASAPAPTPDGGAHDEAGSDAGAPDVSAPDAAAPDARPPDAGTPDASPARNGVVQAILRNGQTRTGELLAVYDATKWWSPRPGQRFALFDPSRFGVGLEDDSVTVLFGGDLSALTPATWPDARAVWVDHRRQQRLHFGRSPLDGPAYVLTAHESYHLEENGYGDFAWDLARTDARGRRFAGLGADNADYFVWDAEVFLPTAGLVVEVVRDAPDNVPGDAPTGAVNNLIGVNIGGRTSLYLLHFREGTIPAHIEVGQQLEAGTYLGRVGNSGVSLEPHLHMTLLYWLEPAGRPARYYSVPGAFDRLHVAERPEGPAVLYEGFEPPSGVWISDSAF